LISLKESLQVGCRVDRGMPNSFHQHAIALVYNYVKAITVSTATRRSKMRSPEERIKGLVDRYAKDMEVYIVVLQQRIEWHRQQWTETEDASLKNVHERLLTDDVDNLNVIAKEYEKKRINHETELPAWTIKKYDYGHDGLYREIPPNNKGLL